MQDESGIKFMVEMLLPSDNEDSNLRNSVNKYVNEYNNRDLFIIYHMKLYAR